MEQREISKVETLSSQRDEIDTSKEETLKCETHNEERGEIDNSEEAIIVNNGETHNEERSEIDTSKEAIIVDNGETHDEERDEIDNSEEAIANNGETLKCETHNEERGEIDRSKEMAIVTKGENGTEEANRKCVVLNVKHTELAVIGEGNIVSSSNCDVYRNLSNIVVCNPRIFPDAVMFNFSLPNSMFIQFV